MAEGKGKAPDNNKRLAALEAGVSVLAMSLTANGITIPEGADPIEEAIKAIKFFAEVAEGGPAKIEALETELHQLAGYASATIGRIVPDLDLAPLSDERPFAYLERLTLAANPRIDELIALKGTVAELEAKIAALGTPGTDAAELAELRKRVTELTAEVGELEQDLLDIANDRNALRNQLAADGKGTAPAPEPDIVVEAPAAAASERAEGARDVGPEHSTLTAIALGVLVAEGGTFEILFSSGEFELVEFGPLSIPASGLTRVDGGRYVVDKPIQIGGGAAVSRIHGAGLFYGGEQVGYTGFEPPITVQPGQQRRFDRALIFG